MNELATRFGDKAAFIGISDESEDKFNDGLKKHKLSLESFKYNLALDPTAKMKNALKISGIPQNMIVSSDGIVRWQGHPMDLNASVMDTIIKADDALKTAGGKAPGSVSKKTTAVVLGRDPGQAKASKAEELGIPTIDEAGFVKLLETGELPS